jgi:PPOX class probable F420-dependent enzyme
MRRSIEDSELNRSQRSTRGARDGDRVFVRVVLVGTGAFMLGFGVWCLVSTHAFARFVNFPYNQHFIHDAGAFQIGIGATLVLAAAWADAAAVALAGFFVGNTVHVVNHVVDLGVGGHGADPRGLGLLSVLSLAALVVRMRQLGWVTGEVGTTAAVPALEPFVRQKTVRLTSYRRDSTPVGAVSIAVDGDRAFVRSPGKGGKVKRIRDNPTVEIGPCTALGKPIGPATRMQARLLAGKESRHASRLLGRKYPMLQGAFVPWAHRLFRGQDGFHCAHRAQARWRGDDGGRGGTSGWRLRRRGRDHRATRIETLEEEDEMRVFVAGATGAIGRPLVPQLIGAGHQVTGTTRSLVKVEQLGALGADAVVMDGLDRSGVMRAVEEARPDVVVHELTSLAGLSANLRNFDRQFAATNQLRTRGLDHLLEAARAAGAKRIIAQSFTGWPNIREGGAVKTEEDPLDPHPPARVRRSIRAIQYLEGVITGCSDIEGLALRYGFFYGAGTPLEEGGQFPAMVRKRRFPIVGDGSGVWSFIHIDDAAAATVAALGRGAPGVYNVVDDEPAPVSVWLPYLAEILEAKPPMHVPVWLGRLAGGEVGVSMMTMIRGSSNAKAKRELGWQPRFESWREGFRSGLSTEAVQRPHRPAS